MFLRNQWLGAERSIYHADTPFGPYVCVACGAVFPGAVRRANSRAGGRVSDESVVWRGPTGRASGPMTRQEINDFPGRVAGGGQRGESCGISRPT